MKTPLVTIIIPVYKVETYIRRCVDSVLTQTLSELEIILVDDGSPDQCPSICDEYAEKDPRIHVIHKRNGGLASARNAGLVAAHGTYIFFLDSDDWLDQNGMETLYQAAEKYRTDFVRFRAIRSGWPGLPADAPCMLGPEREIPGGLYDRKRIEDELLGKIIATPEMTLAPILGVWESLYRRSFLEKYRIRFDERIRYSEDIVFSARVVYAAERFYYIDRPCVYHYFYNPNSISRSFRSGRWESCKMSLAALMSEFGNKGETYRRQIEILRWFFIFLSLNERRFLTDEKEKRAYARMILEDPEARCAHLIILEMRVGAKVRARMALVKAECFGLLLVRGGRQIAADGKNRGRFLLTHEKSGLTLKEAERRLMAFHPMPSSTSLAQHHLLSPQYDLLIIVPAYNVAPYIRECLDSVLAQATEYTYLLRVIDDGSTDETGVILDAYAGSDNVEVIHEENRGYSGARNRGLMELNARYVSFLDADDYLLPGAIDCLMRKADEGNFDVVEGNGIRFGANGTIGLVKDVHYRGFWGGPWMKVFNAKIFERFSFPEEYLYEDKIISALVLPTAKRKVMIPDQVYAYRIHPGSITQRHDADRRRLDSYWIMLLCEKERETLGLKADMESYRATMRQIVMTYRRTALLPEDIREAIFICTGQFLEKYYLSFVPKDIECHPLAEAILRREYGKYKIFCETHMIL